MKYFCERGGHYYSFEGCFCIYCGRHAIEIIMMKQFARLLIESAAIKRSQYEA